MMGVFFLFVGDQYYPQPGLRDYVGSFESIEAAMADVINHSGDWYVVIELQDGRELRQVAEGSKAR